MDGFADLDEEGDILEAPEPPPLMNKPSAGVKNMEELEGRLRDQLEYLGDTPIGNKTTEEATKVKSRDLPVPSLQKPGWKQGDQGKEGESEINQAQGKMSPTMSTAKPLAVPVAKDRPQLNRGISAVIIDAVH